MRTNLIGAASIALLIAVSDAAFAAAPQPPLVAAVKQGETARVRDLLRRPGEINSQDVDGTTAVYWAVNRGDMATLDLLLGAGADVKIASRYGVTPLSLAAESGNAAIVVRLLKAGADPNSSMPGGETVLMTAARAGKADVVKALLAARADVNASESTRGQTALMWAAAEGNTEAAKVLVESGADLNARSRGPKPVMSGGKRLRDNRIDSFTPLMFAVRAGHLDTTRYLLNAGASPNDAAEDGTSLLTIAIANANWELGSFLLDYGADATAAGQGWTALHQLVRTRNPNLGQMPGAMQTGTFSSLDLARKLVRFGGANVDARMTKDMNDGNRTRIVWKDCTPLLLAAKASDHEMMRVLVELGADPKAKNAVGSTVLMLAAGLSMFHVSDDSGTDEDSAISTKYALEIGGGDVNDVDADGDTALHGAAQRFQPDSAELLLKHGARVDIKNKAGATALMLANGFSVPNMQKQPRLIKLLRDTMVAQGLTPEMWIAGQAKVDENIFEVDPAAVNVDYRANAAKKPGEPTAPAASSPK